MAGEYALSRTCKKRSQLILEVNRETLEGFHAEARRRGGNKTILRGPAPPRETVPLRTNRVRN
jgi:hypothetical protein